MPPSRRDVLIRLLGVAAAPLLPACGPSQPAAVAIPSPVPLPPPAPVPTPSEPPPASSNTVFAHGVASGDPLSDRVILWTRVSGATATTTLRWRLYADVRLTQLVREGMRAGPNRLYSWA